MQFPGVRARPHLSLAELQHLRQPLPLRRREVFLCLKLLLQLDGLVVGEADLPPFPLVQRPLDEGAPQQRLPFKERHTPSVTGRPWTRVPGEPRLLPEPGPGGAPSPGPANFLRLILLPPVPSLIFRLL